MPTPPMRGKGLVCRCRSEIGGTNKPRATAVVCTQNVMTMEMAKETTKLHTKRITANLSPCFPGCGLCSRKTEVFGFLQDHLLRVILASHIPLFDATWSLELGDGRELEESGPSFAGSRSAAKKQSLSRGRSIFPLAFLG